MSEHGPFVPGFADRRHAGRALAERLRHERLSHPIVLALPRGGVPVGFEVATALGAMLEVFVVRKLGAPQNPELGIGAVAEGGTRVVDEQSVRALGISDEDLEHAAQREAEEVRRRVQQYRGGRPLPSLADRCVLVVDDGLATGLTAAAALTALRNLRPQRLILAIPVCAADTADRLRRETDQIICLLPREEFVAVGMWYRDFSQTSDEEVQDLLEAMKKQPG